MAVKLNNFSKIWKKESQIAALFSTQKSSDDWPDALDNLAIALVVNK